MQRLAEEKKREITEAYFCGSQSLLLFNSIRNKITVISFPSPIYGVNNIFVMVSLLFMDL